MKRIDIRYDGEPYSIGNRSLDELIDEIERGIAGSPGGFWLEVNHGEGQPRPTFLRLTAQSDIALTPIPEPASTD
ncbi:hypothetical protein [Microbacterium sp. 10M-3C3]|jgi:hypothetical protein|uniref:hypothetical protein n=1 Tax=Microbacterium sp. 10M-3C3 TaxID=2483401 RepID=UPI000F63AE5F|nr:hypothetical protein [Microbacterium sp. 10M-3C3]